MRVSVIIPMYNAADSIKSALESVSNQTYKDFEIIVVNDGSNDRSHDKVAEFIAENPEINLRLINQINQGVSAARNTGLKAAQGDLVALLDSDDEWLPAKLARQISLFETNPEIDLLGTNRNNEHYDRFLFKKLDTLTQITPRDLLYKMFFITPTVIFKRSIVDEIGYFDESQQYCEDGQYFIRICQKKNCYLLSESLVITGGGKAHFGERGLSSNLYKMQQGELRNLRYAMKDGVVNFFEYGFIYVFSTLKYLRRIWLVKNN